MAKKTIALILAGGAGTRLDMLSNHRAKPAVPFAGKYRIIDFTLSNCVNSGIYTIGILTQYLPRSLSEHIGIGRPWDLDRSFGGITMLPPYMRGEGEWYNGTANAVYQNMNFIADQKCDNTVILAGDHIYKMNYQLMIKQHEKSGADVTIAVKTVDKKTISQFGIVSVDKKGTITSFEEKPSQSASNLASMGIYVFKTEVLRSLLVEFCKIRGGSDFGKDIIPYIIGTHKVSSYKFKDYWKDVGTLEEYWKANIELTEEYPPIDLYDKEWVIHTRSQELPPVKLGKNNDVIKSLISNGCIIDGRVENCVISPGVIIEEGAVIKNSIVFNNTIIKKDSVIDRAIIDKDVIIEKNCRIGVGDDYSPNKEEPNKLYTGINLIGKYAFVPEGTFIERNCRIMSRVANEDYDTRRIKSGETIKSKKGRGVFDFVEE